MGKTEIEWTDKVWNPVTGCTKVSAGCKNCYAERMFHRPYPGRAFTDVQTHPERLDQPLRWRKPCRIFVNSMSDLFHEFVPDEFLDRVFAVMALSPQHTFQVLTKRPERMAAYCENSEKQNTPGRIADIVVQMRDEAGDHRPVSPLPHLDPGAIWYPLAKVWLGVSVEDQKTADERIPLLLQTPAAVRFVSYEPALGPVDFSRYLPSCHPERSEGSQQSNCRDSSGKERTQNDNRLDWLIAGGESGPHARPSHPDWFRSVRDQCEAAGVPFFFKQWGEWGTFHSGPLSDLGSGQLVTGGGHLLRDVGGYTMARFGKKLAGRLLDGREWNQFPSADFADGADGKMDTGKSEKSV